MMIKNENERKIARREAEIAHKKLVKLKIDIAIVFFFCLSCLVFMMFKLYPFFEKWFLKVTM